MAREPREQNDDLSRQLAENFYHEYGENNPKIFSDFVTYLACRIDFDNVYEFIDHIADSVRGSNIPDFILGMSGGGELPYSDQMRQDYDEAFYERVNNPARDEDGRFLDAEIVGKFHEGDINFEVEVRPRRAKSSEFTSTSTSTATGHTITYTPWSGS